MIDDKKIEDAAKSLRKDFNDDVTQGFLVEFGFEKGAKWAINEFLKDLWHPISEKPKKECVFLYKTMFKGYGVHKIIDRSEWKCIIKYQKATKWLYIDDLFSKKEGKS
jgi:hypothetical protein